MLVMLAVVALMVRMRIIEVVAILWAMLLMLMLAGVTVMPVTARMTSISVRMHYTASDSMSTGISISISIL